MSEELRLDQILIKKFGVRSRERAQDLIARACVLVAGKTCTKPGKRFSVAADIQLLEQDHPYVSRGALKLAAAIDYFTIAVERKKALDVGASTGGFTQLLLERGAEKVYCVDVGKEQLVEELKQDSRVNYWEQTHIKNLKTEQINDKLDIVVVDVSFISLQKVIPFLGKFLRDGGDLLLLLKPQFELGPDCVNKHGVVTDVSLFAPLIQKIQKFSEDLGFMFKGEMQSPIKGAKGNTEFLLHLTRKKS